RRDRQEPSLTKYGQASLVVRMIIRAKMISTVVPQAATTHLRIGSTMRPLPDRSDPFLEAPFLEASGASRTSVGMCFSSVAFVGLENEPPRWGGGAAGPGWLSGPAMARATRRPLRHL